MLYLGHCWSPTPSRQALFETSDEPGPELHLGNPIQEFNRMHRDGDVIHTAESRMLPDQKMRQHLHTSQFRSAQCLRLPTHHQNVCHVWEARFMWTSGLCHARRVTRESQIAESAYFCKELKHNFQIHSHNFSEAYWT